MTLTFERRYPAIGAAVVGVAGLLLSPRGAAQGMWDASSGALILSGFVVGFLSLWAPMVVSGTTVIAARILESKYYPILMHYTSSAAVTAFWAASASLCVLFLHHLLPSAGWVIRGEVGAWAAVVMAMCLTAHRALVVLLRASQSPVSNRRAA